MRVITGQPNSGKTTKLIEIAAEKQGYRIVCRTSEECQWVAMLADKLGKKIDYPICIEEFVIGIFNKNQTKGFLFDDIERLLMMMTGGIPVVAMSVNERKIDDK